MRTGPMQIRAAVITLTAALPLSGCALHWPWRHHAETPQPVHEVTVTGPSAAEIRQFWDRNTLLIDLTVATGEGEVTLAPIPARGGWPVRLECRVQPGRIAELEVLAAQRVVFDVPGGGAAEVLALAPGVYAPGTTAVTLRWRAASDSPR